MTPRFIFKLTISIIVLNFSTGCVPPVKLQPYNSQSIDLYKNAQNKNGLIVAAYPLVDEKESIKYFGFDLTSNNILAIYVSIENRNSFSRFTVCHDKSYLSFHDNERTLPGSASPKSGNEGRGLISASEPLFFVAPFMPATLLVGAPMAFVGQKQWMDAQSIKFNFHEQELSSKTLPPQGKTQGFLYFQIQNIKNYFFTFTFHFEAIEMKTKELVEYDFPLLINQKR